LIGLKGEIVAELPTSHQWSFDVSWCPRNPAIIASASFDGHVRYVKKFTVKNKY
jgi:hypothetical protein